MIMFFICVTALVAYTAGAVTAAVLLTRPRPYDRSIDRYEREQRALDGVLGEW